MLNIGKLGAGGERYYLDTVASGVEDYYTGSGEAAGYWLGAGTAALGLCGIVQAEALRAVLGAADPTSGQRLTRAGHRRVPGFDLTFRAPKSVSVLYGLADEDVAGVVRDAHDRAVAAALGYLERQAGWSRRGVDGVERVRVAGLVAAAFRHRSSRAGDPLLHTHVLLANLGQATDDGCWRTLDARQLYRHAKTAGYVYQAALRTELTRRLPRVGLCRHVPARQHSRLYLVDHRVADRQADYGLLQRRDDPLLALAQRLQRSGAQRFAGHYGQSAVEDMQDVSVSSDELRQRLLATMPPRVYRERGVVDEQVHQAHDRISDLQSQVAAGQQNLAGLQRGAGRPDPPQPDQPGDRNVGPQRGDLSSRVSLTTRDGVEVLG